MTPINPLFQLYCDNLRKEAVQEIRENFQYYRQHLYNFANELIQGDAPIQEKVTTYLERLENPGYWGGAECLSAVANRYKVRIRVYQSNGIVTFTPLEPTADQPLLRVFYRGGNLNRNHYDSTLCIRPTTRPPQLYTSEAVTSGSQTLIIQHC